MDQSPETSDDELEVIPKALVIVVANFVPLLYFAYGTTDLGAVGALARGLFFEAEGPTLATAVMYFFLATTSLLMAAVALLALLTPRRVSMHALRSAGGLLGAAILVLAVHLILRYFVTIDWVERAGLIFMAAGFAAFGIMAWRFAKPATERG